MAKLFLRNAYEFENPSRRVFRDGGSETSSPQGLEEARKALPTLSSIGDVPEAWVTKEGNKSSQEAIELVKRVEKEYARILAQSRLQQDAMFAELFPPYATPDVFSANGGKPIEVTDTYKNKGILKILELQNGALDEAFAATPALRLLAYAHMFRNFDQQGKDVNVLPIGSIISMQDGLVTVKYPDGTSATSMLFPWPETPAEAPNVPPEEKPEESPAPQEPMPPATNPPEEAPRPAEKAPAVVDDRSEYEKRLDDRVDAFGNAHDLDYRSGEPIGLTIGMNRVTYVATLSGEDGTKVEINVGVEIQNNDQTAAEKALEQALEEELARLARELARGEKKEEAEQAEALMDAEWTTIEASLMTLQNTIPGTTLVVREPSPRNGQFNRTKHSKIVEVSNTTTGRAYKVEVNVPVKDRPSTYADPRVDVSVWEQTFLGGKNEYVKCDLQNSAGTVLVYTGANRINQTVEAVARIIAQPTPPKEEKAPQLSKKKEAEAAMDALFAGLNAENPDWRGIEAQYKAMLASMPDGRISAQHHLYGANAAWSLGNVEEARTRYERAKRNAGDGSADVAGIDGNLDIIAKHYAHVELTENVGAVLMHQGNFPAGQSSAQGVYEYAANQLKTTGHFEGSLPLGVYMIDGGKTVTVTLEGVTVEDKSEAPKVSTGLTPENMRSEIANFRETAEDKHMALLESYSPYLSISSEHLSAPAPDGSANWTVVFKTADGETFPVHAETGPVDQTRVDSFVEGHAALGETYSKAEVTSYFAYLNIMTAWARAIEAAKVANNLESKYKAYQEKPTRPIEPVVEPRAPEAAPSLPYKTEISPEAQTLMTSWDFTMKGIDWRSRDGLTAVVPLLASVKFTALGGKLVADGTRTDGSPVHYEGSTPAEFMANVEYKEIQYYLSQKLSEKDRTRLETRSAELLEKYPHFAAAK